MKSLLFLCSDNRIASPMAEGLARHFIGHQYDIFSAGVKPADRLHPMAVAVMGEIGIDISNLKPKDLQAIDLAQIDTAIVMCDDKDLPQMPDSLKRLYWPTTSPVETNVEIREDLLRKFRKIRDDLRKRVLGLRASDQTW